MRRHVRQGVMFAWLLILLLFVAACAPGGQASGSAVGGPGGPTAGAATPGSTSSATNPSGSSSPPAEQPTPGSASLNGCPSQQPPPGAANPTDVVVSSGGGANGLAVSLRAGQTLEVRLAATVHWGLQIKDTAHILTASTPNGWYDASLKACVWRFTATGAGSAALIYGGSLVCAPHSQCATIAEAQDYTITVQ